MKGENYLSDKGVIDINDIDFGKLNIIDAPCGSGKTTFVENILWHDSMCGDLLYLTDSKNGLEAFKRRGKLKEWRGIEYYKHEGITAMTYAGFAIFCKYNQDNWTWNNDFALIVCDEMQSCIKWAKIKQKDGSENIHKLALEEIHKRIKAKARVIAISATTDKIKEEFKDEYVAVPIHGELKQYEVFNRIGYRNVFNVIKTLPADKKGIIYVQQISTMVDIYNYLSGERGITCACVWSISNKDYNMDEFDLAVRKSIIETERIPDDVQVLIINAASETGLNIKSDVDYMVVNTTNAETITQVIGRVRHDINTVYCLEKEGKGIAHIEMAQIKKWMDKPLTVEDKNALCAELDFRDERGRVLGWTSIKKSLKFWEYNVIDKHTKKGDYSIISF